MENIVSNPEIQSFIKTHLASDASALALKYKEIEGVPIQLIIRQIQGKQKSKNKLPSWFSREEILFPPSLNLEQSSSEITADYKAGIVDGKTLVDLTGGFGVDVTSFSRKFEKVYYVERNEELLQLVVNNLKAFQIENVVAINTQSESFLLDCPKVDCIYLDPARRDKANRKIFLLEDCEPDIKKILPLIFQKTKLVLIKTSPLLDLKLAVRELKSVQAVHVVAVDNECKEVLYLLSDKAGQSPEVVTINFAGQSIQSFTFDLQEEGIVEAKYSLPLKYLYEPNVAILKAGAFNTLSSAFGIYKLHKNSHLYTSNNLINEFPGRKFEIKGVEKYDKKAVKKVLSSDKANITSRNFPDSVEKIRKRLDLKEGGENYLFATTDFNKKPVILITKKI